MMPCVRDFNTGFICFDDSNKDKFADNFETLLQYLLAHNPLYKDVEEINQNNIEFTRKLINKVDAISAIVIEPENEIDKTPGSRKKDGVIYVGVSSKSDGSTIQLPFEVAIASLFPVLFPNGPLTDIPGNSLRKKVKNLLLSSRRYRCGPVAANLILFCFDLIEKDENYYFQAFVKPKQLVSVPVNYDRSIPINSLIRKADPSFGLYWHIQLESINGYCEIFGNPDLMMTLTFGNNWLECSETIDDIKSEITEFQDSNFGMTYCGVESMYIFEERLSKIKENKFEKLLSYCNLPNCKHMVCRLEFQNRGAPHVHILMWLERRISLSDIQSHFFARTPPVECEFVNSIVETQMIHTCKHPRCFSGKNKDQCKYGFPKKVSDETKYEDGKLIYERCIDETNIVEYNPALLNEWGAHAHVHILRCKDNDIPTSDDSCTYVLKYNMKHEPNITISVNNPDLTWKSLFKGRIVSLEEATARIFSFAFCQKDVITKYLNIQLPDKRKANFENWKQKNYDDIEAYFLRPKIAENYKILDFYSSFDIKYLKDPNKIKNSEENNCISKEGRLANVFYEIHKRPNQCIVTFPIFDYSTHREEFIYEYLIINNILNEDLRIEEGESYDKFLSETDFSFFNEEIKNSDPYCFYYIKHLLSFERYSIDKVLSKLVCLLSRGIPKLYIIESINSFIEKDDSHLNEINPNLGNNQRIINVLSSFTHYCDEYEAEYQKNEQNHEKELQKYINTNYSSEEIENARIKFEKMSLMLNKEQKECVDTIIDNFDVRTPIFISGKAGTGKSFVVDCLQNYFISQKIKFVVTASTGIAAVIIGGKTIHSTFSIYSENERYISSLSITNAQGKALAECDVIFVDEVTMANRSIFDLIDRKLKELKAHFHGNKSLLTIPFGGTMLILSGDLGQVPCVVKDADDMKQFLEMFNNMESFSHFKLCSLKTIMRRNDESDSFLNMLDEIRNYNGTKVLSKDVTDMIKSKFIEIKDDQDYFNNVLAFVGLKGMAIFYKNASCDKYNNFILESFAKEREQDIYSVRGHLISIRKRSYLNGMTNNNFISPPKDIDYKLYHAYLSRRESQSLVPFCFRFCIGARVILLKNIDTTNGLVNGRRGEIKEIIFDEKTHLPDILIVHFDQISIFPEIDYDITFMKVDTFRKNNGSSFSFYQFPLKLCFAVTSHKCQGQTLDKVAICIDEPAFAHGSFYVAMSRVRSLDDIIFFGKQFPKDGPILHTNSYISDLNYKIDHSIE